MHVCVCGAELHLVKQLGVCIAGELMALFEVDAHRKRLAFISITLCACSRLLLESYTPVQGASLFIPLHP